MADQAGGKCWNCAIELAPLDYGRADRCPKCGKDTRVCRNCGFYEQGVNNECHESQAERVVEKEKSNFCDYFKPRQDSAGGGAARDAMKAAADALFKKR